jgi:hypothetical protein
MTKQTMFFSTTILIAVLIAVPGFAQRGGGNGVGHSGASGGSHLSEHAQGKTDFATKIADDQKLSAKLQPLLPPHETLSQAATGFKNEGQFIAALHVSRNLNMPFDQLKAKMTGPKAMSLGAAVKALRPDMTAAESKEAAKKAESEAAEDQKS